jgi:hypothetical protein
LLFYNDSCILYCLHHCFSTFYICCHPALDTVLYNHCHMACASTIFLTLHILCFWCFVDSNFHIIVIL